MRDYVGGVGTDPRLTRALLVWPATARVPLRDQRHFELETLESTVSVNGAQTFSSWLDDTVNASALLSRTNGITTASGGRDSEDYIASDSTGYCYHHKLVAAQGWFTSDQLLRSC